MRGKFTAWRCWGPRAPWLCWLRSQEPWEDPRTTGPSSDAPPCPPAKASRKGGLVSTAANSRNLHKTDCKSPCSFQHRVTGDPTTNVRLPPSRPSAKGRHDHVLVGSGLCPGGFAARWVFGAQLGDVALPHHQPRAPKRWENWVSIPLHKDNYNIHEPHTPAAGTRHPLSGETLGIKGRKGTFSLFIIQRLWFQPSFSSYTWLGCPLLTTWPKMLRFS